MDIFLQIGVYTITLGSLYAILALGFNILYSMNRFFDMTYAVYIVLGAYAYFAIGTLGFGSILTLMGALVVVALVGAVLEMVLFRRLRARKSSPFVLMIASLGLLTVAQGVIAILFTSNIQVLVASQKVYHIGSIVVSQVHLCMVAFAALLYLCAWYSMRRTKFGVQFRAISQNEELAYTSGIPVARIRLIAAVVAAVIGGVAGILYGMDTSIEPLIGMALLFKGVISGIVAGLGSMVNGIVGAIVLASSENAAVWFISGEWKDAVAFVLLIIILLIRPRGILEA